MLTWILIAVIVAALFGVINFDHIREWSIERSKEAWPYIQKFFRYLGEKMESAKAKVENTQKRVDEKLDDAKEKTEESKDDIKENINDDSHNY